MAKKLSLLTPKPIALNKTLLSLMLILGMASTNLVQAQTFQENFQQGIPNTWTLYNEDGLTPDPGVGFVNNAWVIDDDGAGDTFAVSTSWYAPAGTADDWLVSPLINLNSDEILTWQAKAQDPDFPDGYEVRISTAGNQVSDFLANPPLFSIVSESPNWANRFVDLQAAGYSNQPVYIAFRNNSTDKFLLYVDDVEIDNVVNTDGELASIDTIEYSFIPKRQLAPFTFGAQIENNSLGDLTDAFVELLIVNGNNQVLYNATSDTVALLSTGQSQGVSFANAWSAVDTGFHFFLYVLRSSSSDINPLNDTITDFLVVTDTTYARDGGQATGGLGIGAGSSAVGNYLGQSYEVVEPTVLTSVTVAFTAPTIDDTASIAVFRIVNGLPSGLIAESELYFFPDSTFQVVDFVFANTVILDVDTYAVLVREYSENVTVGTSPEKFTNGTTWINWPTIPTGGWTNTEVFGLQFARTFLIRPNFGPCSAPVDSAFVQQPSCPDSPDGLVILYTSGSLGSLTYEWNNGDLDSIADFLSGQVYSVTVSSGVGCESIIEYDLGLVDTISITLDVTDATTETSNDGSVTAAVTGGTAPYTYEWSGGNTSTTETASDLAAGTVTVTITDANGCDQTATATVGFGVGIFNVVNTLTANVYPNPANNQLFVEVSLEQAGSVEIAIINTLGQVVLTQNEQGQVIKSALNVSGLPAGVYLVQLNSANATATEKLVIE